MRTQKFVANLLLGVMGLFLFICVLLLFIFPVFTTLFTVFTGVLLPESYYLAGNPNSGWVILFIDTFLVGVLSWIHKQNS